LKDANILILVYDKTRKETFDNIYYWYNTIKDIGKNDSIIGVVGTHLDLFEDRKVEKKIVQKFADSIGAKFIEISVGGSIGSFNIMINEFVKDYIIIYDNKDNKNQNNNIVPEKYIREFIKNTLYKFYKY